MILEVKLYSYFHSYNSQCRIIKYINLPVCIPARIVIVLGAISGLTTLPHAALRSSAILQIASACLKYGEIC